MSELLERNTEIIAQELGYIGGQLRALNDHLRGSTEPSKEPCPECGDIPFTDPCSICNAPSPEFLAGLEAAAKLAEGKMYMFLADDIRALKETKP